MDARWVETTAFWSVELTVVGLAVSMAASSACEMVEIVAACLVIGWVALKDY